MNIQPLTLEGCTIRLEPLSEGHVADLAQVGCDERIWRYMRYGDMRGEADIKAWVKILLDLQEAGDDLPFAVYHLEDGRAVGATRYMAISRTNRGLEIGGTWYGIDYQRTGVNTEAKYLLLGHAQHSITAGDRAHRRQTGGGVAQPLGLAGWPRARFGLLFNHR